MERCSRNSVGLRSFLSNYQNNIISRYYCNVGRVLGRSHKHANPFKSFRNISMAFVDTLTDSIRFDVLGLCKSTLGNSTKDILYSQNWIPWNPLKNPIFHCCKDCLWQLQKFVWKTIAKHQKH